MMKILKNRPGPIGLDIGHCGIRAVQYSRSGASYEVFCAQEHRYHRAQKMVLNENNVSQETIEGILKETITRVLAMGHFDGHEVILHCPSNRMDIRPMSLPCGKNGLDRETTLSALKCEMEGHLDFAVEHAVFDYQVIRVEPKSKGQSMVVYSADGEWIARRIRLVESIGLHCREVDALPCVLHRIARTGFIPAEGPGRTLNDENREGADAVDPDNRSEKSLTVVIDLAEKSSTLVVADSNGPFLSRYFNIGGYQLSQALGDALIVEPQEGDCVKCFYGLARYADHERDRNRGTGLLQEMASVVTRGIEIGVKPLLHKFIEGIIRTLNYVITDRYGFTLDTLYLLGGGSALNGIQEWMSRELEMPVKGLSSPLLDQIRTWIPGERGEPGLWATAAGLALLR